jgi:site-specific DNA-cytosine methylase
MKYVSVCSGIEAASVAWHGLGWKPAWFSEIEAFPSRVLAHHYPEVENRGDFTKAFRPGDRADILVGGTPCQSFSIASASGCRASPTTGRRSHARNAALGNSMAVPVMGWIGERIDLVDRIVNVVKGAA